jgi:hypothetical protein
MSRTLMKHPRARSHFTAARATSGDLLRLALRIIRANPPRNLRSPTGANVHQSGAAICVMREAWCVIGREGFPILVSSVF